MSVSEAARTDRGGYLTCLKIRRPRSAAAGETLVRRSRCHPESDPGPAPGHPSVQRVPPAFVLDDGHRRDARWRIVRRRIGRNRRLTRSTDGHRLAFRLFAGPLRELRLRVPSTTNPCGHQKRAGQSSEHAPACEEWEQAQMLLHVFAPLVFELANVRAVRILERG